MTTMHAGLIATYDRRWQALLQQIPHDTYHLPEYLEACTPYEGGEPVAFFATDGETEFLLPLLLRSLPESLEAPPDWWDLASPCGYPGPLASDPYDTGMPARALCALKELGQVSSWITAFVRIRPLLPLPPGTWESVGDVVAHGSVAWIDLTRSPDEISIQMRTNHRRGIRKLAGEGFETAVDDWAELPCFERLYEASMRRVNAAPFYLFASTYYDNLRAALRERMHLCTRCDPRRVTWCQRPFSSRRRASPSTTSA